MYGASRKMGRGGGGGGASAGKRNINAPPINRAAPTGRLSMGGGPRGRGGASSAAISPPSTSSLQVEESFSLVRENPLNFGMAIKLTPDLVEEIKRVEEQGGTARIKFDANANNTNGNVSVWINLCRSYWIFEFHLWLLVFKSRRWLLTEILEWCLMESCELLWLSPLVLYYIIGFYC